VTSTCSINRLKACQQKRVASVDRKPSHDRLPVCQCQQKDWLRLKNNVASITERILSRADTGHYFFPFDGALAAWSVRSEMPFRVPQEAWYDVVRWCCWGGQQRRSDPLNTQVSWICQQRAMTAFGLDCSIYSSFEVAMWRRAAMGGTASRRGFGIIGRSTPPYPLCQSSTETFQSGQGLSPAHDAPCYAV